MVDFRNADKSLVEMMLRYCIILLACDPAPAPAAGGRTTTAAWAYGCISMTLNRSIVLSLTCTGSAALGIGALGIASALIPMRWVKDAVKTSEY